MKTRSKQVEDKIKQGWKRGQNKIKTGWKEGQNWVKSLWKQSQKLVEIKVKTREKSSKKITQSKIKVRTRWRYIQGHNMAKRLQTKGKTWNLVKTKSNGPDTEREQRSNI